MNQGDVHKVIVLNTVAAVTRVRIFSVACWKEPSIYHKLSCTPLVPQEVHFLISQEQQCGSTVSIRRESENSVDPAARQAAALCAEKTALHTPAVSQSSPLLASHKPVPTSFVPSKLNM